MIDMTTCSAQVIVGGASFLVGLTGCWRTVRAVMDFNAWRMRHKYWCM